MGWMHKQVFFDGAVVVVVVVVVVVTFVGYGLVVRGL